MRTLVLLALMISCARSLPAQFVRPQHAKDEKLWGVEGGIVVGVHPGFLGHADHVCPRGLIRIGLLRDGKAQLINFVSMEPLVGGRKGLSELERSADGKPGKEFFLANSLKDKPKKDGAPVAGVLRTTPDGRTLSFVIHCEPFANGAQPLVEVTLFEKQPLRVRFRTFAAKGSAKIEQLTLSATMGNMARTRHLWLAQKPVYSLDLYRDYRGNGFVEREVYGLDLLHRNPQGEVVVAITPDEYDPSEAWPRADGGWRCPVDWLAQYWLKPKGSFDSSLTCRVNGRRVYWQSRNPIPGGPAYENFEFREAFRDGQETWFGFSIDSPAKAFGFAYDLPASKKLTREITPAEKELIGAAGRDSRSLTNGQFQSGLDGWTAEPSAKPFRVFEEKSEHRMTTFGADGDAERGRLYQCFRVPADANFLRFFLHGGCDSRRLRVNLWHGNELVRWMTGRDHNDPIELRFSLTAVRGQVVTLEIVDESQQKWGFLGVHGVQVVTQGK